MYIYITVYSIYVYIYVYIVYIYINILIYYIYNIYLKTETRKAGHVTP